MAWRVPDLKPMGNKCLVKASSDRALVRRRVGILGNDVATEVSPSSRNSNQIRGKQHSAMASHRIKELGRYYTAFRRALGLPWFRIPAPLALAESLHNGQDPRENNVLKREWQQTYRRLL